MKTHKKAPQDKAKIKIGRINSRTKVLAATFPMTELIDKHPRTGVPGEVVDLKEAASKKGKKKKKAKLEAGGEKEKDKLKEKKKSAKKEASSFPMVELIDEQVRTSI